MDPSSTPVDIGPTEDGSALRIEWRDGVVSTHLPRDLRLACPCAGCVDEMTGRPLLDPATVPEGVYPAEIRYVGRYALQFMWSDGHSAGLYTFPYLRRLWQSPVDDPPESGVDG